MLAALIRNIMRKPGTPAVEVADLMPADVQDIPTDTWADFTSLMEARANGEHINADSLTTGGN